jgi:hypothetical protein
MKKMLKRVEGRKNVSSLTLIKLWHDVQISEDDAASRLKEGDDRFPRGKPRSKMLPPDETPVEVPSKSPANLVEDKVLFERF